MTRSGVTRSGVTRSGKTRIGVIGCGFIGDQHMRELSAEGAVIAAVADPLPERLDAAREAFPAAAVFESGLGLIEKAGVDAVSVCSPLFLHECQTIAALSRGLDVLCEKPMAMNAEQAAAMVSAAKASGRLLMLAFNQRFDWGIARMVALQQQGFFGKVYHGRTSQIRQAGNPAERRSWFLDKRLAGAGVSFDLGAHAFYRVWYAMGKPFPEYASAALYQKFVPGTADDFAAALVRFRDNRTLVLETGWEAAREDAGKRTMVMEDKGGASLWTEGDELVLFEREGDIFRQETLKQPAQKPLTKYRHFLDCLEHGSECLCPAEDGYVVQCVLDAVLRSAELGREVSVDIDPLILPGTREEAL